MLYEVTGGKKVPLQQALKEFNRIVELDRCCHFDARGERCSNQGAMPDPETGRMSCLIHIDVSDSVH